MNENPPEGERCFLGAYLYQDLDDFIRLRTFSMAKSRSKLVTGLLEEWQKTQPGINEICTEIAQKAYDFWKKKSKSSTKLLTNKYLEESFISDMIKELSRAKISDEHISKVVEIFKNKLKDE